MNEQQHEMVLEMTHPSGVEEWYCPTCGRRFLLQWPPAYKKIILEPGDELISHGGGKGGLRLGPIEVTQVEESSLLDERLRVWQEALGKIDMEDFGD